MIKEIIKKIIKKCGGCADWYSSQEEKEKIVSQRIRDEFERMKKEGRYNNLSKSDD